MTNESGKRENFEGVIREIVAAIERHRSFLIATHVHPDGDAIGSLLAMASILQRMGKKVYPYSRDSVSPAQRFLPGVQGIIHGDVPREPYEVAILLDCGDLHRGGPAIEAAAPDIPLLINIDHHVTSSPFGDIYWVDPAASSTCEMLYDLSLAISVSLDSEIATQIYTGILTDTGSFRFSNTNGRVLEVATALVSAGADPARIARETYESLSPQRLKLLAGFLSTAAFEAGHRLAAGELSLGMLDATNASYTDGEGFIDYLRAVKTVQMAILFREEENGSIYVSLRSKGEVDVSAFAQLRNGGGHRNAAAFRASGNLASVRAAVTREALEYLP